MKNCCPEWQSPVNGSPIIQDGKLMGAVAHVPVNDPMGNMGLTLKWGSME